MTYFVTAIGTDSGKTVFAAILTEFLKADYWKPIQAGAPRDADEVRKLVSNSKTKIHPEAYLLNTPASPHASAKIDRIELRLANFSIPESQNHLVIEGAGGMLVPINNEEYVIELAPKFEAEIILVCNLYLGSINHTLLSIEWLKKSGYKVKGIVFNGSNPESEKIIELKSPWPVLQRMENEDEITKNTVLKYAEQLGSTWK